MLTNRNRHCHLTAWFICYDIAFVIGIRAHFVVTNIPIDARIIPRVRWQWNIRCERLKKIRKKVRDSADALLLLQFSNYILSFDRSLRCHSSATQNDNANEQLWIFCSCHAILCKLSKTFVKCVRRLSLRWSNRAIQKSSVNTHFEIMKFCFFLFFLVSCRSIDSNRL